MFLFINFSIDFVFFIINKTCKKIYIKTVHFLAKILRRLYVVLLIFCRLFLADS